MKAGRPHSRALQAFLFAWLLVPSFSQDCTGINPSHNCLATQCCKDSSMKCYEKDSGWAACKTSCTPGINPYDPPEYQTPWTCKVVKPSTGCTGDDASETCLGTKCCQEAGKKCYEKDSGWASCKTKCTPGVNPYDPPEYQTPWTCKVLGGGDGGGKTPAPPPPTPAPPPFQAPKGRRRRTKKVPQPPANSAVDKHGHLKTKGNKIVDKNGKPVRLRGMSLFWSQWKGQFYTEDVVEWLKSDWKATVVRAAMGVDQGGYLSNPDKEKKKVEVVVEAAISVGIYVIIDWHEHHAEKHLQQSKGFFNWAAEKYGRYPNVLFEPYNEPEQISWEKVIKPYHEEIIPIIRHHSANLVICGTRSWSQEVDRAAKDPVKGTNIAYTLHFYASSAPHQEPLRRKAKKGLDGGVPLFVTEWGTCDYTGNGDVILEETTKWYKFLDEHHISDANWAVGDKDETCATFKPGTDKAGKGGWKESELTKSGSFVRKAMRKAAGSGPTDTRRRSVRRRRRTQSEPRRRRSQRRRGGSRRRRRSGGGTHRRRRTKSDPRRRSSKQRRRR